MSSLYSQLLSLFFVLFIYHVAVTPVVIDQPIGALAMLLVAWLSGVGVGMIFLAMKPWAPDAVKFLVSSYNRASMIASGKMFVANSLPSSMLVLFDWNPLFHTVDQARGYIFFALQPTLQFPNLPVLRRDSLGPFGIDGRILYPQKRLDQLGCLALTL